jgi:hypothetical protein
MTIDYLEFIEQKRLTVELSGFDVDVEDMNPALFDWQRDIVKWAIAKGKAALFEDCGLGKTIQQLEWARLVQSHTNQPVIIFAPLAVAKQSKAEGLKFGIDVNIVADQSDIVNGINVTNYHKLHHFSPDGLGGIVLDESSILKGMQGHYRRELTKFAKKIPYKLCCTATPAPNDLLELTNHADFLGIMQQKESFALFFTQDGNSTVKSRLKGHAHGDFWRWIASWSVAIRKPSDLGYDDNGFNLPALNMHESIVAGKRLPGMIIRVEAQTMSERRAARRESLPRRCQIAADLVNGSDEQWVVWCDLNGESELLTKLIPDAVEVAGKHKEEHKENAMLSFAAGEHRVIVTKPTIAGFGMNWQNCHNMVFVGLSDSYEQMYQATRRCWRFGQTEDVDCHVVTADTEGAVVANIKRKEDQATKLFDEVVQHMTVYSDLNKTRGRDEMEYKERMEEGENWKLYLGDSALTIDNLEDESVGLTVFSPPFPGMYVYTNSVHDMGNVKNNAEMIEQFSYLAEKILQKTIPSRSCAIHLTQGTMQKARDGHVGLKDFRGQVIEMMSRVGWIYYGEVCIDKNPQVKAIRTKDRGLLFKSLANDSANMHMALADYILQFRKPGDNPDPIRAGISEKYGNLEGWITQEEWIRWARPVWYGADFLPEGADDPNPIRETDVLNVRQARETNDERHLAPLQLGVIERCIKLWSAPGELVYSPFAGIGSEGYQAVRFRRRFVGGELKESYFNSAIENLKEAERVKEQKTLFDFMDMTAVN